MMPRDPWRTYPSSTPDPQLLRLKSRFVLGAWLLALGALVLGIGLWLTARTDTPLEWFDNALSLMGFGAVLLLCGVMVLPWRGTLPESPPPKGADDGWKG